MDNFDARFLIEAERRKGEMALAAQNRLVKEAQRDGLKLLPLLSLSSVNIRPLFTALALGLAWLSHLFAAWSCRLQSRYPSLPLGAPPESQSSPC